MNRRGVTFTSFGDEESSRRSPTAAAAPSVSLVSSSSSVLQQQQHQQQMNATKTNSDMQKDQQQVPPAVPFHPTLSLSAVPHDMTTGCAGGYSTSREGELIFTNDDHGASHASAYLNCVTIDSAIAPKTAVGSISRLGKDGIISRMNTKDTKTNAFSESYFGTGRQGSPERLAVTVVPPPLPVIPVTLDLEGNFAFTKENKPKWNSFKLKMEGPTEYS